MSAPLGPNGPSEKTRSGQAGNDAAIARPSIHPDGDRPLPGQQAVITAALVMGFVLLSAQLWLLTVALDLYLAGKGRNIWILALISGLIALGGYGMHLLLQRRPHVQRLTTDESGREIRRFEGHP